MFVVWRTSALDPTSQKRQNKDLPHPHALAQAGRLLKSVSRMVSGNNDTQTKMEVEQPQVQPPSYEGNSEQVTSMREGLYTLTNKKSRNHLDLSGGNPTSGSQVQGYEQNTEEDIGNQLWLLMKDGLNDTYTLRNLQSGTYLDLFGEYVYSNVLP